MFISNEEKSLIIKNFNSITEIIENTNETLMMQSKAISLQNNVIRALMERIERLEARQPTSYRLS